MGMTLAALTAASLSACKHPDYALSVDRYLEIGVVAGLGDGLKSSPF